MYNKFYYLKIIPFFEHFLHQYSYLNVDINYNLNLILYDNLYDELNLLYKKYNITFNNGYPIKYEQKNKIHLCKISKNIITFLYYQDIVLYNTLKNINYINIKKISQ